MTNKDHSAMFAAFLLILAFCPFVMFAQSAADGFKGDVNGPVAAVATGTTGAIYIAGQLFTNVNGVAKSHLARLNRDGTLDTTYNPNPNSSLQNIAVTGQK